VKENFRDNKKAARKLKIPILKNNGRKKFKFSTEIEQTFQNFNGFFELSKFSQVFIELCSFYA
jgi:hypothetical protein